jgi:hypothetical protein
MEGNMRCIYRLTVILWVLAVAFTPAPAQQDGRPPLLSEHKAELIRDLSTGLTDVYVFPDVAERMVELIQGKLDRGEYDGLDTIAAFTRQLTEDLQSISHDKHLHVSPTQPPPDSADGQPDRADMRRSMLENARFQNFGFEKIERLPGNIGYLDLRGFFDAEAGGDTAVAAMNYLANSSALIIDLRQNGGGSPSMIQLISSYFFDEPQHLNTFYIRQTDSYKQFWTQSNVRGPRLTDTPVYVLTSGRTFSAAEEFTYNLKNMERATIVGETTGGGAHPVEGITSIMGGGHHARISMPFGRAINPITETNWEGTGVEPHIQVPAAQALDVAQAEILKTLAEKEGDPERRFGFEWASDGLESQLHPVELGSGEAEAYMGQFGPRKIMLEDGRLFYQRDEGPRYELVAMGDDRFRLPELDMFRIQFGRDGAGRVVELTGQYSNGRTDGNERSN